jgi:NAD(P)-dependent dehydrogenase (short-subunit alcohol dehydrogenase family)
MSIAVVFGASGGIGGALVAALTALGDFDAVLGYSRPDFDLPDEARTRVCVEEAALQLVR